MVKAAGGVIVVASGLALGLMKRGELAARVNLLRRLRWEVGSLRSKIYSRSESLEQAFGESKFFKSAAEAIARGESASAAVMPLGEGIEGFELFAAGLMAETGEGQLQNIDIFLDSLEGEIARAQEELERRGRLYVGGGFLAGAALVIMLI